jgi:predicted RND superfamily exporter protein
MKFREPGGMTKIVEYVIGIAIGLYVFGYLAGGSTGFIAVIENITSSNPVVTAFLGLLLVFAVLGLAWKFWKGK